MSDFAIVAPALVAGLLVLATHVPLGREVLRRGIIFIDLAIAQIAGAGVVLAHAFEWAEGGLAVQLIAGCSALAGAVFFYYSERLWPEVQEAIIGTAFVLAATASVLLLAGDPHGAEQIKELLVGQILWVNWAQLAPVAATYAVVLALWFLPWWRSTNLRFYFLFAVAVTASVQMVGVYLVFASLIIPALAVRRLSQGAGLAVGYLVGTVGYAAGLALSLFTDLPAGALVVWMIAIASVAAALLLRLRAGARRGQA